jgi:hypothetical protein
MQLLPHCGKALGLGHADMHPLLSAGVREGNLKGLCRIGSTAQQRDELGCGSLSTSGNCWLLATGVLVKGAGIAHVLVDIAN